ncbi:MAG TPA: metallophosphoesterase family protein [Candidatus Limnocylindrales bacterium]|nr:metallophosphoesterase family protein [Candidatus Limnocylindrales bacterium]
MRICLLSDIHSNLVALDAVLEAAGEVDAVWHLGDVVGYGPDPDGVVARLRERGALGVRGNHDAAAVGGSEIDWFNPEARRAMEWTRGAISDDTRDWLSALPERRTESDCDLVHGSPREPLWEYVTSLGVARDNLGLLTTRIGLHGHTHVPAAWVEDGKGVELVRGRPGRTLELAGRRALLNPGSVGQPRDGDPDAAFAILDLDADTIEWRRAAYDIAAVQAAMRAAGLPTSLASRLRAGL